MTNTQRAATRPYVRSGAVPTAAGKPIRTSRGEQEMTDRAQNLVAQIVQANVDALSTTTNSLLDSYRREAAEQRATVRLIREKLDELLSGPYAPSEAAIRHAMYPPRSTIRVLADNWQDQLWPEEK